MTSSVDAKTPGTWSRSRRWSFPWHKGGFMAPQHRFTRLMLGTKTSKKTTYPSICTKISATNETWINSPPTTKKNIEIILTFPRTFHKIPLKIYFYAGFCFRGEKRTQQFTAEATNCSSATSKRSVESNIRFDVTKWVECDEKAWKHITYFQPLS